MVQKFFKRIGSLYGHSPKIEPGLPPGTLRSGEHLSPTAIRVIGYDRDRIDTARVERPEELSDWIGRWPVVWIRVTGLADVEAVKKIGDIFDLHALVLEDVINEGQRPKLENYDSQLFLVLQMAARDPSLILEQISICMGENYVITFQDGLGERLDPIEARIERGRGRIRTCGPDYLTYAIADTVVDGFFPLLENFGEELEDLEDDVITRPDPELLGRIHSLKRELVAVRRALWPQREAVRGLMDDESGLIRPESMHFLRDCYDHIIQALDLVETYREAGGSLADVYLTSISNRMNEVMKVLTIIATIFIPLTFIAGIYGMNFSPEASPLNMPELGWYWGYPAVMLAMLVIALIMVFYFRRKKWL